MAMILAQRVLKLIRGSVYIACSPFLVVFAPKDPGVVLLLFDDEDSSVADKYDVYLSRTTLIGNDDVPEFEELEARLY